MWRALVLVVATLLTPSCVYAQQTQFGYVKIECDTDGVPVYIDGGEAGLTPLEEKISLSSGTHVISLYDQPTVDRYRGGRKEAGAKAILAPFFGDCCVGGMVGVEKGFAEADLRNVEAGTKRIFVRPGKTMSVFLSYRKVREMEKATRRSRDCLVGGGFFGLFLLIAIAIAR